MSKKQEYIARVKYFNNLPAPSVAPKLLNYITNSEEDADAPQLVTSLYNKTNVTPLIDLDNDLGMPLDLMNIPGLLNKNDTKLLYGFENIKLHPDDRVLLRDPRADRLAKTDTAKVSFLRRTEYVSSTNATPAGTGNGKKRARDTYEQRRGLNNDDDDDDRILTAPEIVTKVENTFDSTSEDLSKLVHPVKRHLKAVESWNLLPDTASMDENYFSLRLVGSAALDKREKDKLALKTAIFRPVELEEDEWISMYTTDKTDSDILNKNVEKVISEEADDNDESNNKSFKFKRVRDFDMQQAQKTTDEGIPDLDQSRLGELAILFNQERGIAYYKPLRARIELRRRRVNDVLKTIVREHTVDQINISVRNPTTKEANAVDRLRMKYDPINFVPVDDEDSSNSEHEVSKGDSNLETLTSQE
ncbi:similar to Saccharomyces cerevisiae YBR279W PAF1 Component of the Paf1p complex [Maudiozyma barnettii]|uniref:Similar to Saccharomyces cerevisiae YBR279W PAF1 Component of the Paf1p complex n=1 Tax=Maudiozyma barnettii TaxID=61262 RepID=A0A8H2ZGF9_9SACH|nr:Paf1p [Kazachstania barnettii]CAB4254559.1 similar to Saccharomyces cerevisiae YBR279W PAF1 Component of the Paf1p complex [Kazachstania barnettii]CAD1782601.1 similar to Saccharomyces cerevisiae YBR279W PAF1 Component of the Paf1p complex [Kazachstania barnettii]